MNQTRGAPFFRALCEKAGAGSIIKDASGMNPVLYIFEDDTGLGRYWETKESKEKQNARVRGIHT